MSGLHERKMGPKERGNLQKINLALPFKQFKKLKWK
jgi:hypothetical protein